MGRNLGFFQVLKPGKPLYIVPLKRKPPAFLYPIKHKDPPQLPFSLRCKGTTARNPVVTAWPTKLSPSYILLADRASRAPDVK